MVELLRTARVVGLRRMLRLNRARRLGWEGIISGFFTTRTMNALFNVGLFDELVEKGRVNIESFGMSRGLDTRILKALCDSLYSLGILKRDHLNYSLDSKGQLLVETARGWFDLIYGYEEILHLLEPLLRKEIEYGKDVTRRSEFVAQGSGQIESWLYFPMGIDIISKNGFKRVLDLGCGDATFLISLCNSSDTVTGYGVDISPEAIADAHQKLEKAHLQGRVHLFTEDIFKLERIADSLQGVDAATAFFVLHEFLFTDGDRVVRFLRNFRELFPGVPLILFEAIRPTPEEMRKRPGAAIQYFLFHDLSKQKPVSREDWKELFSQAGFNSISERYLGFARTGIYTLC